MENPSGSCMWGMRLVYGQDTLHICMKFSKNKNMPQLKITCRYYKSHRKIKKEKDKNIKKHIQLFQSLRRKWTPSVMKIKELLITWSSWALRQALIYNQFSQKSKAEFECCKRKSTYHTQECLYKSMWIS